MNHDLFYLFKRRERIERNEHLSSFVVVIFFLIFLIMNDYYGNSDNALNEAQNILNQKSDEDLKKIMKNDDEVLRFVGNLTEV